MQNGNARKSGKVTCNECGIEFLPKPIEKEIEDSNFTDVGLQCPNGHFFHSFFDHPKLKVRRKKIKTDKDRKKYQTYYQRMQDLAIGSTASRR